MRIDEPLSAALKARSLNLKELREAIPEGIYDSIMDALDVSWMYGYNEGVANEKDRILERLRKCLDELE